MKKYHILWSPLAEETYLKTLISILEKWTIKEVEAFEEKVDGLIEKLEKHKNLCPISSTHKKLRRCAITSQTSLVYKIKGNIIELVIFFDNRSEHQY